MARRLVIGYVPKKDIDQFRERVMGKRTAERAVWFSDEPGVAPVTVKRFATLAGVGRPSNGYALQAFMAATELACNAEHFLYVESDCAVVDGWDAAVWDEFERLGRPACAGYPVFFNAWQGDYKVSKLVVEYAHEYQQRAGLPPAFEGCLQDPFLLYPNGALAVYDVKMARAAMDRFFYGLPDNAPAFDHEFAHWLVRTFGARVFDVVGGLACVYSICNERQATKAQMLSWLESGFKVAVHKV